MAIKGINSQAFIWLLNHIDPMSERTSSDFNTSKSHTGRDVYETVKDNFLRTIDEIAKVQPQFSQSISNLQIDYIQTTKNMIQNVASTQRQLGSGLNIPGVGQYSEQFAKQSTELTNNTIRAVGINNQLAINALDAARENLKIYNRTIDAVTDFSTNIAKAWESFFSAHQQNFFTK
jgi:hypothetical protein